jgi:hypothetical protein
LDFEISAGKHFTLYDLDPSWSHQDDNAPLFEAGQGTAYSFD